MDLGPAPDDDSDFAAVLDEVPADQRADGWTGERRIGFLRVLWNGASVTEAARHAGMTTQSARRLRLRAPAFRASWDEAQAFIVDELADTAFERAVNGSERPVYSRGQLVGHRTVHHDRLLLSCSASAIPKTTRPSTGVSVGNA